jgi:hypothetical protein
MTKNQKDEVLREMHEESLDKRELDMEYGISVEIGDDLPQYPNGLYHALHLFQQEVPNLIKGAQGYGYKFVDLGELITTIKPILAKYKLGFSQPMDGDRVKTIIFYYPTGQTIESSVTIPQGVQLKGMNDFQVLGSAISYLRRYSLVSCLGLVSEVDNDASGVQVKSTNKVPEKRSLSDEQFKSAIDAIKAGEYSKNKLIMNYSLTGSQYQMINALSDGEE